MRFNNRPAQLPEILIATSLTLPLDELVQTLTMDNTFKFTTP